MPSTLEERYANVLESLPDGPALLAQALALEDEYQQLTARLIRDNGGPDRMLSDYASPLALSGGSKAAMELLAALSDQLRGADPELPKALVRWWPERQPNAGCAMGESGALIRVNLGMLTHLRLLIHLLSSCLASITGDQAPWGADRLSVDQARSEYLAMMDEFVGGEPVPLYKTVLVHWGRRERFRRVATLAGLAYVIAHELGHAGMAQAAATQPEPCESPPAEPEMISTRRR